MTPTRSRRLIAPLLAVLSLAAVPAAAQPMNDQRPMPGMHGHGDMPPSPGSQAMMDSMQRMQQDMAAVPMTGDTDRDFAAMMREHHRGAVNMARAELQHGKDPELKRMARKVVDDQEKEIRQFDKWLERHPPRPERQ